MWLFKSKHRHIKPETLNEYLDGRLSGNALAKIESRLQACDSCRVELEELRATITAVQQLPMEQPRRSFVMAAPPPMPVPARQSFPVRAPTWAYAGAASIAVVALAVLVSVDATGGLSPAAESPEAVVATAPQNRAIAPEAAATAVASPMAAAAQAQKEAPQASAAAAAADSTALTDQAARSPEGDGAGEPESTFSRAALEGEDSAGVAPPSDSAAVEEPGTPSAMAGKAAEPLPEPPQAPVPAPESAPAAEVVETTGGTYGWVRVLEGLAAVAALVFVVVLVLARRASRN